MSYDYQAQKPCILTPAGQEMLFRIFARMRQLCDEAGAVRMQEALSEEDGGSWDKMACVDYLVEMGEFREVTKSDEVGQYRVFVGRES